MSEDFMLIGCQYKYEDGIWTRTRGCDIADHYCPDPAGLDSVEYDVGEFKILRLKISNDFGRIEFFADTEDSRSEKAKVVIHLKYPKQILKTQGTQQDPIYVDIDC